MTLTIAVGTTNPAKLNAVQKAFELLYPAKKIVVTRINVDSGVSAQPMSSTESIIGAKNRAHRALEAYQKAEYGVGLEGGLEQIGEDWFDCGWCAIEDRKGVVGVASSARIPTPKKIMDKIFEGLELGDVIDQVFHRVNVKQAEGHFGLMTNNAVTRTDGYVHGICMAFSRFLHPEMF